MITLASWVTLLRLCSVAPLAALVLHPQSAALTLSVFGIAAATDWADGAIARRWNQKSALGARLDALTDKIFIFTLVVLLSYSGILLWPLSAVVLLRDVAVQLMRNSADSARPIPANYSGKAKFVLQCVSVALALASPYSESAVLLRSAANFALAFSIVVSFPGIVIVWRSRAEAPRRPN